MNKVERAWAREPPADRSTLSGLLDDFRWRLHSRQFESDPCVPYVEAARVLPEAIIRACASRGANGRMWNHQSKVPGAARDALSRELVRRVEGIDAAATRGAFRDLFEIVEDAGRHVEGIGPLTIYDVAMRLAAWYGLTIDAIYPHAGVAAGLAVLGLPTRRPVQRAELPPTLALVDDLNEVEDFLCCYRAQLAELSDYEKESG